MGATDCFLSTGGDSGIIAEEGLPHVCPLLYHSKEFFIKIRSHIMKSGILKTKNCSSTGPGAFIFHYLPEHKAENDIQ